MFRESLLAASFILAVFSPAGALAQTTPPASSPTPAFQRMFSTPYLATDAGKQQWIVSYAWTAPGKEYETRTEPQFGKVKVVRWTIRPDGSLSGEAPSGPLTGYLDHSGLPVVRFEYEGKAAETRLVPSGDDFIVPTFQNVANAGEAPNWKEATRSERKPISKAEVVRLAAQWEQDRKEAGERPATAEEAAVLRRHLVALAAGQPLYQEMSPALAAWISARLEEYRTGLDRMGPVAFVRFTGTDDEGHGLFATEHAYSGALWGLKMDAKGRVVNLSMESQPKRNDLREIPGGRGWRAKSTIDELPLNRTVFAILEPTDGAASGSGWQADCYRIAAPSGRALRLSVYTGGQETRAHITDNCKGQVGDAISSTARSDDFGMRFTMPARETFVWIEGKASARNYQVSLSELPPAEVARWQEEVRKLNEARQQQLRQEQIAEQRRRQQKANQPSMFGAMVRGLAMGLSGVEGPLMNVDGSEPNTLDVLNAANAELARQNAVGQARLDATLAQAQYQASSPPYPAAGNSPQAIASSNAPVVATTSDSTIAKSTPQTSSTTPSSDCRDTRVAAGYSGPPNFSEADARAFVDRWAGANCGQNGVVCGATSCSGLNVQGDPRLPKQISYTCGIDATKPYRSCGASKVSGQ